MDFFGNFNFKRLTVLRHLDKKPHTLPHLKALISGLIYRLAKYIAALSQAPHSFKNYKFYIIWRQKVGLFCSLLYTKLRLFMSECMRKNWEKSPTYVSIASIPSKRQQVYQSNWFQNFFKPITQNHKNIVRIDINYLLRINQFIMKSFLYPSIYNQKLLK